MINLLAKVEIEKEFKLNETTGIGEGVEAYSSIGSLISAILPNIYVAAGIILFFLIVFGGISYVRSAGSQDEEGIKRGQKAITSALVGFLIIFLSYWIIQIVEIVTGIQIFGGSL